MQQSGRVHALLLARGVRGIRGGVRGVGVDLGDEFAAAQEFQGHIQFASACQPVMLPTNHSRPCRRAMVMKSPGRPFTTCVSSQTVGTALMKSNSRWPW